MYTCYLHNLTNTLVHRVSIVFKTIFLHSPHCWAVFNSYLLINIIAVIDQPSFPFWINSCCPSCSSMSNVMVATCRIRVHQPPVVFFIDFRHTSVNVSICGAFSWSLSYASTSFLSIYAVSLSSFEWFFCSSLLPGEEVNLNCSLLNSSGNSFCTGLGMVSGCFLFFSKILTCAPRISPSDVFIPL